MQFVSESAPNDSALDPLLLRSNFDPGADLPVVRVPALPSAPTRTRIDNTRLMYIPIPLLLGNGTTVIVQCRPDVLIRCPQILWELHQDISACLQILPPSVHKLISRIPIWVNTSYSYGYSYCDGGSGSVNSGNTAVSKTTVVHHSTTHHDAAWLLQVANDRPFKAPSIEIYNCFDYRKQKWHWNGCGLLLHEYCHVIHQFCLSLDNATVMKEYQTIRVELRTPNHDQQHYLANTLRRDWAGFNECTDLAYAMVNVKEFFAEISVSYFSTGYDNVPSTSTSFSSDDAMAQLSPPFMAPNVISRLNPNVYSIHSSFRRRPTRPSSPAHCNKFYPFTRNQLRAVDPHLYQVFDDLWRKEIAEWQDDDDTQEQRQRCCCCCWWWSFCCPCIAR